MSPIPAVFVRRCFVMVPIVALTAVASDNLMRAYGQAPPAAVPAAPSKPAQKKIKFEKRSQPWGQVLEWLSDQSGLPLITKTMPTGTFSFVGSKSGNNEYTLPEVIDIINEALLTEKNNQ